jgi:hypothetical protein
MSTSNYKQVVSSNHSFIHYVRMIEPLSVIQHDPARSEFFLLEGICP